MHVRYNENVIELIELMLKIIRSILLDIISLENQIMKYLLMHNYKS